MKRVINWLREQIWKIITGVIISIIVALIYTVVWPWMDKIMHGKPVEIISVQFDALGDDRENLNGEWVKIENQGSTDLNMSGWTLSDQEGHDMPFPPDFILPAGQTVTVYTGSGDNSQTELYCGRGAPVWNNDGDTATLYDSDGRTIDQWISR